MSIIINILKLMSSQQSDYPYMESINPFVALVSTPVFAALSYISPFPSVVIVPNALGLPHSEYYYHVAGNIFWLVLAFFSFYGLYYSIRYKRREMAVLLDICNWLSICIA